MKNIMGIDLGQSCINNTTGICVMNSRAEILYTSTTNSLEDIIKTALSFNCCSAYIDAPVCLQFDEKEGVYLNRKAESVLVKRKNKYSVNKRFSPMPANMLAVLGIRAIVLKERLINETEVRRVFEVHPRTSCEYLNIEHYKTDFKKFAFKLNAISGIDVRGLDDEHVLDSIICAYTGILREHGRCIFIGDNNEGVITVPSPGSIRCVFFDMDGTLTNVKSPWQKVFEDNGIWHGKGEVLLKSFLNGDFGYEEFCGRDFALWNDSGVNRVLIEKSLNTIEINEHAISVIKNLTQKGIKCVIISTGFYFTAKKIALLCGLKFEKGLKDVSSNVLSVFANDFSDDKGILKPELDVFGDDGHKKGKSAIVKKCLKKLKTGPVRCLSAGDSKISDKELFEITGDHVFINHDADILKLLEKVEVDYNGFT